MFYLKILFLVSYFLLVFIIFRIHSTINRSFLKINNYDNFFSSFASMYQRYFVYYFNIRSTDNDDFLSKSNTASDLNNKGNNLDNSEEIGIEISLLGYEDYIEKVEDTKASVWVVAVYPPSNMAPMSESKRIKDWPHFSKKLRKFGIKTGSYYCANDIRLCLIHKVTNPMILLSMPKGTNPKGNVAFYLYNPMKSDISLFSWVKKKLNLKIKLVHSVAELKELPVRRKAEKKYLFPSLSFVYKTKDHNPPLLLSTLSVKFTGRIEFYLLKTEHEESKEKANLFAINQFSNYIYGKHEGENFTYPCMDLFFRTLHPEVNDIFIASLIVLNMACWFEVSLQKGGPLRRILFFVWGFVTSNILLVTIWIPLLKLIHMPQVQPIVQMCLKNLQKIMFTNIAAMIRQDFLEIAKHIHFVIFGFFCYGIFLGFIHFKFRDTSGWGSNTSMSEIFEHDLEDIQNLFQSFISNITPTLRIYRFEARIERILSTLSTSQMWLPTDSISEYIKDLPTWEYCVDQLDRNIEEISTMNSCEDDQTLLKAKKSLKQSCADACKKPVIPDHILKVETCVICLDDYKCQNVLIGLPCGHSFHQSCICDWLMLDGAQNKCPVCRWPCNIKRNLKIDIVDTIE